MAKSSEGPVGKPAPLPQVGDKQVADSDTTDKSAPTAAKSDVAARADLAADVTEEPRFPEDTYGEPLFETKPFEESPWDNGGFVGVDPMYQGPSDVRSVDAEDASDPNKKNK